MHQAGSLAVTPRWSRVQNIVDAFTSPDNRGMLDMRERLKQQQPIHLGVIFREKHA